VQLAHPVQIAYGVDNIRDAAARWVARGVGPFFVLDHIVVGDVRVNGAASTFDHSSAYAWWGHLMVELICQHDSGATSIVPGTGLHHMAFFVDDLETAQTELVSAGHAEVLYAKTATGQAFAMHDARAERGHLIEVYEPTTRLTAFYEMVRQASADPGTDLIRTL
jgi:hypothetical protein